MFAAGQRLQTGSAALWCRVRSDSSGEPACDVNKGHTRHLLARSEQDRRKFSRSHTEETAPSGATWFFPAPSGPRRRHRLNPSARLPLRQLQTTRDVSPCLYWNIGSAIIHKVPHFITQMPDSTTCKGPARFQRRVSRSFCVWGLYFLVSKHSVDQNWKDRAMERN